MKTSLTQTIVTKLPVLKLQSFGTDRPARISISAMILFGAIIVLYSVWRLANVGRNCLWIDEVYSVQFASAQWPYMLDVVADDLVHPPLFYVVMKAWMAIGGQSLVWLKLLPTLFAIATILPVLLLCRELRLPLFTRNLALALMAVNGLLTHYAQDVRMYPQLMFLSVCSVWLFVKYMDLSARRCVPLSLLLVNLLLIYTHYYGWAVVGTELLYVAWQRRERLMACCSGFALLILSYVPWGMLIVQALHQHRLAENLDWNKRPDVLHVLKLYARMGGAFEPDSGSPVMFALMNLPLALVAFPLALWLWQVLRNGRSLKVDSEAQPACVPLLAMLSVLPVAAAILASYVLPQSIWGERHLIIIVVPALLLLSMSIQRLASPRARMLFASIAFAWAALTGLHDPDEPTHWDKLVHDMTIAGMPKSGELKVLSTDTNLASHLKYYLAAAKTPRFEVQHVKDFSCACETQVWVLFLNRYSKFEQSVREQLAAHGYNVTQALSGGPAKTRVALWHLCRQ
ncbi:MAG TPA: hypothetical protein VGP72_06320 [Planctomycetota bacterium]|jgi:uncharacterized membrane protein